MRSALRLRIPLALLLASAPAAAQEAQPPNPFDQVQWQQGPGTAAIGDKAEIQLPAGYLFAGAADTQKLLTAMENPVSGDELGLLMPAGRDWFVVFQFSAIGYVKDDEKDRLDADAILTSIREGNEAANRERKERGWAPLEIVGWEVAPSYNPQSHNLEWAVRGRSDGGAVVNFNLRLLGRKGVMEAQLVCDPEQLPALLPTFRGLVGGYSFKSGERYAEFREGDKIAKYGLAALVAGGAAAAALKTGLLQKFGKFIVLGAIALIGGLKTFFGRVFGNRGIVGSGR